MGGWEGEREGGREKERESGLSAGILILDPVAAVAAARAELRIAITVSLRAHRMVAAAAFVAAGKGILRIRTCTCSFMEASFPPVGETRAPA